jgi:uncharacterized phage protein (TIGR02218 family)
MKSLSIGLKASYTKGTTTFATCWKARLTNNTIVTATSLDRDLKVGGLIYKATQSYTASNIESTSELNVDNLEVEGFLAWPAITDEDIHSGLWDYAEIEIFEVDYTDPSLGRNYLHTGRLGEVRGGRSRFVAEFRGLMQAYTRTIVRLVTKDCTADLGDTRCKVDLVAITVGGVVDTIVGNRIINDATRTEPADWFVGAKLTWTSGANLGASMEVKRSTLGQIELAHAMYEPVGQGDTYTVHKGCMKRFQEDCIGAHNNGINFRGFPDLPGNRIYRTGGVDYGNTTTNSGGGGGGTGPGDGGDTTTLPQ